MKRKNYAAKLRAAKGHGEPRRNQRSLLPEEGREIISAFRRGVGDKELADLLDIKAAGSTVRTRVGTWAFHYCKCVPGAEDA